MLASYLERGGFQIRQESGGSEIRLRVSINAVRSKRVRYWVKYRDENGKQGKKTLKKDPNSYSIEAVRDLERELVAQKRENKLSASLNEQKTTFAELSKWYLKLESVKALASYPIIEFKLKIFNKGFGGKKISEVKFSDLENFQIKRLKEGASPATVDQDLGKVKTMIRKAYDDEIVTDTTLVKFGKVKKKLKKGSDVRTRILSPDEFDAFMVQSRGKIKDMVAVAYYTGMRRGEILSLTWDKIDLKNRTIHLDAADTKDREKREIPICEELHKILLSMPGRIQSAESNSNLFKHRGKAINGEIRDSLKKACKGAGIKYGRREENGFTFHDLRHTFNTNMRKAGVPESVIMEITGYSTREMFDRYNTIDDEDRKNAAKTLDRFLLNGPQNGPQVSEFEHSNKDDVRSSD